MHACMHACINEWMCMDVRGCAWVCVGVCGCVDGWVHPPQVLEKIQSLVDVLSLSRYSNLEEWVLHLDLEIEHIIHERVRELITTWALQFAQWPDGGTSLVPEGSLHELKLQNQKLSLSPPVPAARQLWTGEFHRALGSLCNLRRLHHNRAFLPGTTDDGQVRKDSTFRHLMHRVDCDKLKAAYDAIDGE
eukprot:GHVU01089473.1.p1 GENE.GHVU01089473.1~~GHVU01089473.1.p1  ORF type:complete len:190 (-),score=40.97 GHVU01089473.1:254-823(-)